MEFLTVSSNKLKIILDKKEMEEYGISRESSESTTAEVRASFWRILDQAREHVGFDVYGDKVLLQFCPTKDGGELFVTRLGKIAQSTEKALVKSQNVTVLSSRSKVYRFSGLDALLSSAKRASSEIKKRKVDLLYSDDGAYYLLIEERVGGRICDLAFFGEYAEEVSSSLAPYIYEHSKVIINGKRLSLLSEL